MPQADTLRMNHCEDTTSHANTDLRVLAIHYLNSLIQWGDLDPIVYFVLNAVRLLLYIVGYFAAAFVAAIIDGRILILWNFWAAVTFCDCIVDDIEILHPFAWPSGPSTFEKCFPRSIEHIHVHLKVTRKRKWMVIVRFCLLIFTVWAIVYCCWWFINQIIYTISTPSAVGI